MCRFGESFLPKFPERHSTCSRNVQGIHTRRHGDDDRVVGILYGRITKPLALGSENDRKAVFLPEYRVCNAHRIRPECKRRRRKSHPVQ